MFERFTRAARETVKRAVVEAERRDSPVIGAEHLLLALTDGASPAAEGLARAGITAGVAEELLAGLARDARRGGLDDVDAAALRSIGIDLDAIVGEVEQGHGEGVLTPPRRRGPVARLLRRPATGGHRPFTAEAKDVLVRSLRIALAHGEKELTTRHLAMAISTGTDGTARALAGRGVTPDVLREQLPASP